jgi:DNA-directed RNA polymerase subunit RPC12/RpoP
MTHATIDQPCTPTITCPVCGSRGAVLRHDVRSSLLYFCQQCQHEWQIDPADEPLQVDPAISPGPLKGAI